MNKILMTIYGLEKITKANLSNIPLILSKMSVGDGALNPSKFVTSLVSERHKFSIVEPYLDPKNSTQIIIDAVIPPEIGGWTIREVGLWDSANKLVAAGTLPAIVKPLPSSGAGMNLIIRLIIKVDNAGNITITADNTEVYVTKPWCFANFHTKPQADTRYFRATTVLTDAMNLNDITTDGVYSNNSTARATTARNYPLDEAGTLYVSQSVGAHQLYITYNNGRMFSRSKYNGAWLDWREILTKEEVKKITDLKLNISEVAEGAVGGKVVKRNPSGYVNATFFNQNSAIEDALLSASSNVMFCNTDGFLRKGTLGKLKTLTVPNLAPYRLVVDSYTKTEVDGKISGLVNSAPAVLDTLGELSRALGNDANFATTVSKQLALKLNKTDPAVAIKGYYTGNGGLIKPKDVGSYIGKLHMMENTKVSSTLSAGYSDWFLMNGYGDSDVRFRTGIGVEKTASKPKGYLISASSTAETWSGVTQIMTDDTAYTKEQVESKLDMQIPSKAKILTTETITAIRETGFYMQGLTANATFARGYPIEKAGCLEVTPVGNSFNFRYTTFKSSATDKVSVFVGGVYNNTFNGWQEIINETDATTTATANKIVKRDSNGYIWSTYLNSTIPDGTSLATASSHIMFMNADNFLRKMTLTKLNELLTPLTAFQSSKATNGYVKFPGGVIMQWGKDARGPEQSFTLTYPIAFPTACLNFQATAGMRWHSIDGDGGVKILKLTNTGATVSFQSYGSASQVSGFYWLAIGY